MPDEMREERIEEIIQELVADGLMVPVGVNELGETQYTVTPNGGHHVKQLLDSIFEEVVQASAHRMSIPAFVVRDLLIQHIIEMVMADEPE